MCALSNPASDEDFPFISTSSSYYAKTLGLIKLFKGVSLGASTQEFVSPSHTS
jgi:hypothetical protein